MAILVRRFRSEVAVPQSLQNVDVMFPEILPRNCRLAPPYKKIKVPAVAVEGDVILYTSPDSTFAVTKKFFDAAKKSILIGIYDFTAPHVKELVLQALARKVKVALMLDIDSKEEQQLFDELVTLGVRGVPAPSCASQHNHKVFRSSHEKVVVVDDEWVVIQSGNYSSNSCPFNVKDGGDPKAFVPGNRDTGMLLRSTSLAKFFRTVLQADMNLELAGPQNLSSIPAKEPGAFLIERAPSQHPSKLYPSKTIKLKSPISIQPVLSPDNYMVVIPPLLQQAKRSILIQQQYIHALEPHVTDLVQAVKHAQSKNTKLDVRILLGKLFSAKDLPKTKKSLDELKRQCGLQLGKDIRFVNTDRLVHCHNKMLLIDDVGVLISSQNWSNAAVSENREAGLYFEHKDIAAYFTDIFETDWKDGFRQLPKFKGPQTATPESLLAGGYVRVAAGDYADV